MRDQITTSQSITIETVVLAHEVRRGLQAGVATTHHRTLLGSSTKSCEATIAGTGIEQCARGSRSPRRRIAVTRTLGEPVTAEPCLYPPRDESVDLTSLGRRCRCLCLSCPQACIAMRAASLFRRIGSRVCLCPSFTLHS